MQWKEKLVSAFAVIKVFKKCGLPVQMELDAGVYHVRIPFDPSNR